MSRHLGGLGPRTEEGGKLTLPFGETADVCWILQVGGREKNLVADRDETSGKLI